MNFTEIHASLKRFIDINYTLYEYHASGKPYFGDKVKMAMYADCTLSTCLSIQSECTGAIEFAEHLGAIGGREVARLKLEISRWPETAATERSAK